MSFLVKRVHAGDLPLHAFLDLPCLPLPLRRLLLLRVLLPLQLLQIGQLPVLLVADLLAREGVALGRQLRGGRRGVRAETRRERGDGGGGAGQRRGGRL